MIDLDGQELGLTTDAERVAGTLVEVGARITSGHRHLARQAQAMAVNVLQNRQWVGQTYRRGAGIQALIDAHPEWTTPQELSQQIFFYLSDHPDETAAISHHLRFPCPVFDVDPASANPKVVALIGDYQREGLITKVLWKEGGLNKCHVEVMPLPENKVVQV